MVHDQLLSLYIVGHMSFVINPSHVVPNTLEEDGGERMEEEGERGRMENRREEGELIMRGEEVVSRLLHCLTCSLGTSSRYDHKRKRLPMYRACLHLHKPVDHGYQEPP